LVFIVAPTTVDDRLDRIMDRVSGYVYVQARLGTTGARSDVSDQTTQSLDRLREYDVPKAVGFGISSGEHAERIVGGGADGSSSARRSSTSSPRASRTTSRPPRSPTGWRRSHGN